MNEGLYCLVNIPAADTVLEGPRRLNRNERGADGNWYYNTDDPLLWPDVGLLTIGWYPYVESDPGVPGPYYNRTLSDFIINPTTVSRNASYTQKDIEEVRDIKIVELDQQIPAYDARQVLVDPDLQFETDDAAAWVKEQLEVLEELDVWEDVAAFNTTLPDPIVLRNDTLGARQARQGVELYNEDYARATASGAQTRAGPVTNAWLDGCFAAKDDLTGATPVPETPAELRQDVNSINEYRANAQLNRFEWTSGDVGHGVRIKIRPMEGSAWRPMVARIYDSAENFLYELAFGEFKPGLWATETPAAHRTPTVQDIKAELGYDSTTPFTKRLLIPAARTKLTRKIRYNR